MKNNTNGLILATERSVREKVITLVTEFDPDDEGAEPTDVQAILTVLSGPTAGAVHRLERAEYVLGRDDDADIAIGDPGMSRAHARITRAGRQIYVTDLASTNGTFVNARRLEGPQRLGGGDRIRMGRRTVVRFSFQDKLEQEATQRLYEMTVRDGLTHLYNRRHLDDRIESEFAYAMRHKSQLCVLLLDVDHFKNINDTFGHGIGDEVLKAVARGLEQIVRIEDVVARYGGEEFVILARGIDVNGGQAFAERVRANLASLEIPAPSAMVSVTASFGVSHSETFAYPSAKVLLAAADEALYRAKSGGRNRVEFSEAPEHSGGEPGDPRKKTLPRKPPARGATAPVGPRPKSDP